MKNSHRHYINKSSEPMWHILSSSSRAEAEKATTASANNKYSTHIAVHYNQQPPNPVSKKTNTQDTDTSMYSVLSSIHQNLFQSQPPKLAPHDDACMPVGPEAKKVAYVPPPEKVVDVSETFIPVRHEEHKPPEASVKKIEKQHKTRKPQDPLSNSQRQALYRGKAKILKLLNTLQEEFGVESRMVMLAPSGHFVDYVTPAFKEEACQHPRYNPEDAIWKLASSETRK